MTQAGLTPRSNCPAKKLGGPLCSNDLRAADSVPNQAYGPSFALPGAREAWKAGRLREGDHAAGKETIRATCDIGTSLKTGIG